jgi:hypothetical protein
VRSRPHIRERNSSSGKSQFKARLRRRKWYMGARELQSELIGHGIELDGKIFESTEPRRGMIYVFKDAHWLLDRTESKREVGDSRTLIQEPKRRDSHGLDSGVGGQWGL